MWSLWGTPNFGGFKPIATFWGPRRSTRQFLVPEMEVCGAEPAPPLPRFPARGWGQRGHSSRLFLRQLLSAAEPLPFLGKVRALACLTAGVSPARRGGRKTTESHPSSPLSILRSGGGKGGDILAQRARHLTVGNPCPPSSAGRSGWERARGGGACPERGGRGSPGPQLRLTYGRGICPGGLSVSLDVPCRQPPRVWSSHNPRCKAPWLTASPSEGFSGAPLGICGQSWSLTSAGPWAPHRW